MKRYVWDLASEVLPGEAKVVSGCLLVYKPPDSEWPTIVTRGCFDALKSAADSIMAAVIDEEEKESVEETRPQCTRCKNFYPIEEFTKTKILRTCRGCREKKSQGQDS